METHPMEPLRSELKSALHATSSKSVHSHRCELQAIRDDPDGERFTLIIHVPIKDGTEKRKFELGGIHVSVTEQQLDGVISGAFLASKRFEADQTCARPGKLLLEEEYRSEVIDDETVELRTRRSRMRSILEEAEQILRERRVSYDEYSLCNPDIGKPQPWRYVDGEISSGFEQPRSLKQWHPNACGYHALYNAYVMLSNLREHGEALSYDETDFWAFVFSALAKLQEHRKHTGLWASAKLERATLDENHLAYLISSDSLLRNHVSVVAYEEALSVQLSHSLATKRPHAFILACSSHWISGAIVGDGQFVIMDSHNKPLIALKTSEMSYLIASKTVEEYRPIFRSRMKEVVRYQHYPDSVLDSMYEEGVPEYWKGTLKDKMWWLHRPAAVRTEIVFKELESARNYLDTVQKVILGPTGKNPCDEIYPILPRTAPGRRVQSHPGVYANLTSHDPFLAGFVRRDEELRPGDEGYDPNAAPTVFNRKRPPPPEIKGDAFDRQRVIPGFDQATIERQSCLVVGTGGIGMNVALSLARLGVGSICLVDYDVYDASNLTRQCLGTSRDVGQKKTDVALKNIQAHNLRTQVKTLEVNIIEEWHAVVAAARTCTVIFNSCDAGLMLDFALNSLSKELKVPLCCGQSFGWKYMSEFYTGEADKNCAFCVEGTSSTFSCHNSTAVWRRICGSPGFSSMFFLAENKTVFVDFLDDFFSKDDSFRFLPGSLRELLMDLDSSFRNTPLPTSEEGFAHFINSLHDHVVCRMLPGQISKQSHLGFAARPNTPSTRYFGSWVCPCLACGVTCVSHWCLYLTGPDPKKRNPPTCILFNMDEGMTADEQMAYDCGVALDRAHRSFAQTPSSPACKVCGAAKTLKEQEYILFGSNPVFLRPAMGGGEQVSMTPVWLSDIHPDMYLEGKRRLLEAMSCKHDELLVPRVPAIDPIVNANAQTELPYESKRWPLSEFGIVPLVKSSEDDASDWPGSVRGVASGIRSAVVPIMRRRKCYRLKGCGNLSVGFPLEVKGEDGKSLSLRGCMFEHTCARELFMCNLIQSRCPDVNCGNVALGYYRYPTQMPPTKNPDWKWEAAGVLDRFCAVFETKGEKRLGDDLLCGLERLLPRVFLLSAESRATVRDWLREKGRISEEDGQIWSTATQVESGGAVVDCSQLTLLEDLRSLLSIKPDKYSELWTMTSNKVIMEPSGGQAQGPTLFLSLAFRLGWECGHTMNKFAKGGISWGTYPDAMGIHCNAHANNFVIDAFSPHWLLASVDFDMAFTKDEFVPECWSGKDAVFPKDFEGLIQFERTMGLQTSLAGSDFTSTGCVNESVLAPNGDEHLLGVLFRDTLVSGYTAGLAANGAYEFAKHAETKDLTQDKLLIVLALIANELKL